MVKKNPAPKEVPMWDVDEGLIADAKKVAETMLQKDSATIMPVPFGNRMDVIFVSTDKSLVRGTDSFELGGLVFHVGSKIS